MPRMLKLCVASLMAALISHVPHVAFAETARQMLPTSAVVAEISRAEALAKVQSYLDREDLQRELGRVGLSKSEIESRLASLSDQEVRELGAQMDQATYGGDVVGILVVVLLVVLIIYLAKRI